MTDGGAEGPRGSSRYDDLRASLRPVDELVRLERDAVPAPVRPDVSGVDPNLAPAVEVAVADLARRLGVDPAEVEVAVAASVTWPDRSCGCPQPGMRYPQVPVDGAYIELSAANRTFRYHSGGSRKPFLCERGNAR